MFHSINSQVFIGAVVAFNTSDILPYSLLCVKRYVVNSRLVPGIEYQIGVGDLCKLVLCNDSKSYVGFQLVPKIGDFE